MDGIPKRPSPYWVYEKLMANKNNISPDLRITKNSTIECWHSLMSYVGLRLVINVGKFGYSRGVLVTRNRDYRPISYLGDSYLSNCVESIHSGVIIEGDHIFFGSLISFVYRNKSSANKIRSIIEEKLPDAEIISLHNYGDNNINGNLQSLKRCFSSDLRTIRANHGKVLVELINSPLEKLNEISIKLGLSRSTVNRDYTDLVRSGIIAIEPYIRSENNRDFILVSFQIESLSGRIHSSNIDQIPEGWLKGRIIANKFSVPDRILILTWLDDFSQIRLAIREIEKSDLKVNYVVLQQRTFHNAELNRNIVMRSMGLPNKNKDFKRDYTYKKHTERLVENFNTRIEY